MKRLANGGRPVLLYLLVLTVIVFLTMIPTATALYRIHVQSAQVHDAVVRIDAVLGRLAKDEKQLSELANRNQSAIGGNSERIQAKADTQQLDMLRAEIAAVRDATSTQVETLTKSGAMSPAVLDELAGIMRRLDDLDARMAAIEERMGISTPAPSGSPRSSPHPRPEATPRAPASPEPSPHPERCVVPHVLVCSAS